MATDGEREMRSREQVTSFPRTPGCGCFELADRGEKRGQATSEIAFLKFLEGDILYKQVGV